MVEQEATGTGAGGFATCLEATPFGLARFRTHIFHPWAHTLDQRRAIFTLGGVAFHRKLANVAALRSASEPRGELLGKQCNSGARSVLANLQPPPRLPRLCQSVPYITPMPVEEVIETDGTITAVLAGTMFRVALANKHQVLAHISGKMRKRFIRLTLGDRVKIEMSSYDLNKARIVYRLG